MEALSLDKRYTYADYYTWDDDKRRELIDGIPYLMSPAPSPSHQRIISKLNQQFANFLTGKPCEVFPAPLDVRLNGLGGDDDDVFQPDIVVICDRAKIDGSGCNGVTALAKV